MKYFPWGMFGSAFSLLTIVLGSVSSFAEETKPSLVPQPNVLADVGIDQKPGSQIPLELRFRDENGREVRFGDLLRDKPVILNLVYYECPLLCNQILESLTRSLNVLGSEVGNEFDIISVSIDPTETSDQALAKEANIMRRYHKSGPAARAGWHFLTTDDQESIDRLADAVGFRYMYNPRTRYYAHVASIIFLTPEGKVSRYIYGISYPVRNLRFALSEASEGRVGNIVDQALLLCYEYDPATGRYSFAIMGALRILGVLTALTLGGFMSLMFWRDWRRSHVTMDAPPKVSSLERDY